MLFRSKRIETRSWATNYTGPIAIHAAKKWDSELRDYAIRRMDENPDAWRALGIFAEWHIPLGMVIATATLECCRRTEDLVPDGGSLDVISPLEISWGNYSPGRYGWMFADVKPIDPVPARGFQQLWEWNP